jgi:peroxiredoxin
MGSKMSEADSLGAGPRQAPGLNLPDTGGELHTVGELHSPEAAPATVVVWTCNHCPYALAWHDRLVDVAGEYAGRGVRFLAVNSNDPERYPADGLEAMRERVERERWPFPYLWDETQEAAREWGALTTPHVFVLDRDLRIRYEGAPDADHQQPSLRALWVREALDAILDDGEPPSSTEPVGCSIKWK